jgi:hypothetical protein
MAETPQKVDAIAPDGTIGKVDAAKAAKAAKLGYQILTPEQAKAHALRREASSPTGVALGALETAASGLTLGLSRHAEAALGVDPEASAARRDVLGGVGTAIEIASGIAPAIATGGTSAAASGGSALRAVLGATPAGMVARGAATVGRAVAPRAGLAAAALARGAIEGAAQGAATEIDEAALEDRELIGEQLLASGLLGAVLGAGGEVVLGHLVPKALGGGLGKVGRHADTLWQRAGGAPLGKSTVRELDRPGAGLFGSALSTPTIDAGSRLWADAAGLARGVDRDVAAGHMADILKRGGESDFAKYLGRESEYVDEAGKAIAKGVSDVNAAHARILERFGGEAKLKNLEPHLADVDHARAMVEGQRAGDALSEQVAKMVRDQERLGGAKYHQPDLEVLADATTRLRSELATARKTKGLRARTKNAKSDAAATFHALERFKRDIGVLGEKRGWWEKGQLAGQDPRTLDMADAGKDLYGKVRATLEDESIFGKAAVVQRETNSAHAAAIAARKQMRGVMRAMFRPDGTVDTSAAVQLARNFGREKGLSKHVQFDNAMRAEEQLYATLEKHYDIDGDMRAAIADARTSLRQMRGSLDERAKAAKVIGDYQAMRGAETGDSVSTPWAGLASPMAGAGAGFALGGLPGAAIGGALGAIMSPATSLRTLAGIARFSERISKRSAESVSGFFERSMSRAKAIPRKAKRALAVSAELTGKIVPRSGVLAARAIRRRSAEERDEMHARTEALAADPEAMLREFDRHLWELDEIAPTVAARARQQGAAAIQYLRRTMPPAHESMATGRRLLDPYEVARYERRVYAVRHPLETIDLLAAGRMTREHVDALREVYPAIYADLVRRTYAEVVTRRAAGDPLPAEARSHLTVLLGSPADDLLSPAAVADLQRGPGPGPGPEAPQARPVSRRVDIDQGRYAAPTSGIGEE